MQHDVLIRNNVTVFGNGSQPMLFAHGFGCGQTMWRFVAPAFADTYHVVLFDYVGSGASDSRAFDPARYNTLAGYAQDVLDVCAALDLRNVIFVGHSVSCMIGLLASIQMPERFSQLVMIGPSPCYINHPPEYIGGFERADLEELIELMGNNYISSANFLAPVVMQNADRPELVAELGESFCSTNPIMARCFAEATFFSDNRRDLAQASVPSLILQCSSDNVAPAEVGEYLHHNLPFSTFRAMQATGHCPHMSHPQETIQLIREYLDAIPAPSSPMLATSASLD